MESPNCGKLLDPRWRFCDKCGASIYFSAPTALMSASCHMPQAPVYQYCTGCGTHIEARHYFCTKCGRPRYGLMPNYPPQYHYPSATPRQPRNYKALASFISAIITSIIVGCLATEFLNNISPISKGNTEDNAIWISFLVLVPFVTALVCSLIKKTNIGHAILFPILIGSITAVIVCLIIYLLTAAVIIGMFVLFSSLTAGAYTVYIVVVES